MRLTKLMQKKHNNVSRKTYSFLEIKLRQSLQKSWLEEDNMICVIKKQHTMLAVQIKYPVRAPQYRKSIIFMEYLTLCPWKTNA